MTINELIVQLQRLRREGHGSLEVYQMRHGDKYNMPTVKVRPSGPAESSGNYSHVTLIAANPELLWPNEEHEAVCTVDEALYDSVEDREKWAEIRYHWRNS